RRQINMAKGSVYLCLIVFLLGGSAAAQQGAKKLARQPIAITPGFFASLNTRPKHMATNKLSAAVNAMAKKQDLRIISLPNFTSSFAFDGQTFPFTMVGQDPAKRKTSVIPTQYIALSFFFDEFVDQNGNNIVIDTSVVNKPLAASPLFNNAQYGTGFTQYEDSVMRAEFFPLFNKDGDADKDDHYHVLLGNPQPLIPVTIEVPFGSSQVFVDNQGTFFALIDINFLVSQLNTLLQTEPVSTTSIPMLIGRNAVYGDFFDGAPVDCCIGGFHSAFESNQVGNKIFVQTLAFGAWLDSDVAGAIFGDPTIFADVFGISHELGETLNDPFVNNATPSYQLPGFPAGACKNILEVGDVVEETANPSFPVTLDEFTYHPQTLALLQWFEGVTSSNAFNGDYSFPGNNLTAPFTPCPATP
ncbi:MAG TPA: hypothetical protein VKB26_07835, partial [Candidatus Acidoferrales bacterium]|nr:hypothetical protein [Candidatus Acidoferrales bacterium]